MRQQVIERLALPSHPPEPRQDGRVYPAGPRSAPWILAVQGVEIRP
jgi:hypothetical protein